MPERCIRYLQQAIGPTDIFEDIQNTRKGRLSRTRDVPEKTSSPEPVALVPLVASSDVTLTKKHKRFSVC